MSVKLDGNYFKQNKIVHPNTKNVVNIYVVYNLNPISYSRNTDFTIQNALIVAVKITEDASDSEHKKYTGYGICFDEGSDFNFGIIVNGKNEIIYGADMSFSSHSANKANNFYVLGKDVIQGINRTTIYAEKIYKHNFTEPNKKFVLSLHYNFSNSYLFVNDVQQLKFKAKANHTQKNKLCVGNLSSDWTVTNSEKLGFMEKFMILM